MHKNCKRKEGDTVGVKLDSQLEFDGDERICDFILMCKLQSKIKKKKRSIRKQASEDTAIVK